MENKRRLVVHIVRDLAVLAASVALAIYIGRSDAVAAITEALDGFEFLGVFMAGLFFPSIATVAPATVILGGYATTLSPFIVALIGAAGSMMADLLLFHVARHHIARDLRSLFAHRGVKRLHVLARSRLTRSLLPLLGGFIIVSPLPDELGIAFIGLTRGGMLRFALFAYSAHFVGILLIGLAARAL